MSESPDEKRLSELDKRLKAMRKAQEPEPKKESHVSQAQVGWRMVIDLVVGLLLGFGMGYGLDIFFGTLPIFLILFSLLGFAGGVRAMMRTAEEIQKKNLESDAQSARSGKTDDTENE